MRTITFKTYTFDELTPEAREKAIENVRDGVADINQPSTQTEDWL